MAGFGSRQTGGITMERKVKHVLWLLAIMLMLPFGAAKASAASPQMAVVIDKGQTISLAMCVGSTTAVRAKWTSSNSSVACVTSYGLVTGKRYGQTIVKAVYAGTTRTIKVIVAPKLKSVKVAPSSITLYIGETYQLKGTRYPSAAKDPFWWTSSKPSVATVSVDGGKVTARKAGVTYVTLHAGSKTAKCKVTVKSRQKYMLSGKVTDAADGSAVSGVSLTLRSGYNNRSGAVYASAKSSSYGAFKLKLTEGNYTLQASKSGYTTAYVNISCSGDLYTEVSITKKLQSTQYRAVLSWGYLPYDLDAHLTGPLSYGSRFHIYWSNKNAYNNGALVANLDVDDRNSYGPETVTIDLKNSENGAYQYYVHDYSNRFSDTSMGLSSSGARVALYRGNTQIAVYYVPTGRYGTCWHVFDIVNGTVKKVNTIYNETYPSDVGQSGTSAVRGSHASGTKADVK